MNTSKRIAPHEAFELHELLTFKNICATKSATMSALINDEELKELLHRDFIESQEQIKELQALLQSSEFAISQTEMNSIKATGTTKH